MLGTTGAVVLALAWNVSPANAAVRGRGLSAGHVRRWLAGCVVAAMAAVVLVALAWVFRHKSPRGVMVRVRHGRLGGIR